MVCCMMWNVHGLDGLQSVKWCRMVWWRKAYGVKWWREIAVWSGMPWCDFKCFVVWIYIKLCVAFRALSVLCSVQCNVSRIQCTQCSVSVYWASAFNASSVQHHFSFLSSLHGRVCSIHSQWCSVLAGLQSTAFMVCLLLFSVGSVQSSIQLSVGFRVYSVQCQFSVCSVQGTCVLFSGSFSVCTLHCLQCSEHWLFTKSVMFRVDTLKVLCPCAVLEFQHPVNHRVTWGQNTM